MARIDAALQRIAAAPSPAPSEKDGSKDGPSNSMAGPVKVLALVNSHEKLREEVADTLRELDEVIAELEG